jgi:hypothetical protein
LFVLCPLAATDARLTAVLEQAKRLEQLQTLIIVQRGEILAEHGYRGHRTTTSSNIKSASKSVISALVGIAIDKDVIEGVEQPIAGLLKTDLPQARSAPAAGDGGQPAEHAGRARLHLRTQLRHLGGKSQLGSCGAGTTVRGRPRLGDDLFDGLQPSALGNPYPPHRQIHVAAGATVAGATRRLRHQRLDARPAGHLPGRQRDGDDATLAAGLRRIPPWWAQRIRRAFVVAGLEEASWTPHTRSRYTRLGYGYGWFITVERFSVAKIQTPDLLTKIGGLV